MCTALVTAVTGKTEIEMEFDGVETLGAAEAKAKQILRDGYQVQRCHVRNIELSNGKKRIWKESRA